MAATECFHNVLHFIQTSSLNYRIELSPFSATIHLKNSFLKDKNGNPITFPPSITQSVHIKTETDKIVEAQENRSKILQANLENVMSDSEKLSKSNINLENEIQALQTKLQASKLSIELAKKGLSKDDDECHVEQIVEEQKQELSEISFRNETLEALLKKANRNLLENQTKAKAELVESKKAFKAEIKAWRKDLGEERSAKLKLESKLEKLTQKNESFEKKSNKKTIVKPASDPSEDEIVKPTFDPLEDEIYCTICAEPISDYVPKYFLGTEMNPACERCQDSSISSDSDVDIT